MADRAPACVVDHELGGPAPSVPRRYVRAVVLVRANGLPVGVVAVELRGGALHAADIEAAVDARLGAGVRTRAAEAPPPPLPATTVVVASRDGEATLEDCLASL